MTKNKDDKIKNEGSLQRTRKFSIKKQFSSLVLPVAVDIIGLAKLKKKRHKKCHQVMAEQTEEDQGNQNGNEIGNIEKKVDLERVEIENRDRQSCDLKDFPQKSGSIFFPIESLGKVSKECPRKS